MAIANGATEMAVNVPRLTRAPSSADSTVLVSVLGIAALVELAVLRTFTRTAIHIPALEQMQGPYELLAGAGRYAYFVAAGLVFPVLALLALQVGRGREPARWLALTAIAGFAGAALATAAGLEPGLMLGAATIWAIAVLAVAHALAVGGRAVLPVIAFAAAFALSGAYTVLPEAGASSQPAWLLDGAELAGLAFALSLPLIVAGNDRRSTVAGGAVALLALTFFLGNGSTSRFLLLWNVGLSGTLPGVAYAAAAGAIAFAAVRCLRIGSPLGACGVVLLVAGGIGLHSSYQSALAIAGLTALYLALRDSSAARSAAGPASVRPYPAE